MKGRITDWEAKESRNWGFCWRCTEGILGGRGEELRGQQNNMGVAEMMKSRVCLWEDGLKWREAHEGWVITSRMAEAAVVEGKSIKLLIHWGGSNIQTWFCSFYLWKENCYQLWNKTNHCYHYKHLGFVFFLLEWKYLWVGMYVCYLSFPQKPGCSEFS